MSITYAVNALDDSLKEVKEHLPAIEDIKNQRAKAESELKATVEQRDAANKELKTLNDQAAVARQDIVVKAEAARNEKANELHDLQTKVDKVRVELDRLQIELKARHEEHDQVLASFESLKKRLG